MAITSQHTALPDAMQLRLCSSCGSPGRGRYCPNCGQRTVDGPHTFRGFARGALHHIVGGEGVLRTAQQLTASPGKVIRDYLAGRTVRYVNPLAYLLLAASAFAVVGRLLGGSTGAADSDRLFALLVIPFVAAASRLLHWRGRYNLAEHLIIVAYLGAQVLVLLSVFYPGLLLVPARLDSSYATAALALALGFFVWGYTKVFDLPRYMGALASIVSLVLGAASWLGCLVALLRVLRH